MKNEKDVLHDVETTFKKPLLRFHKIKEIYVSN